MKIAKKLFDNLEEYLIFALFLVIMLTVTFQIINREFIGATIVWTEELARMLYIWVAYLGFPYVMKKNKALRIDIAIEALNGNGKTIYDVIEKILTIGVSVWLFFILTDYMSFSAKNLAPALRISLKYIYVIFPVSMVLMIIRAVGCIIEDVRELRGRKE